MPIRIKVNPNSVIAYIYIYIYIQTSSVGEFLAFKLFKRLLLLLARPGIITLAKRVDEVQPRPKPVHLLSVRCNNTFPSEPGCAFEDCLLYLIAKPLA